jgi:hypothetical protein
MSEVKGSIKRDRKIRTRVCLVSDIDNVMLVAVDLTDDTITSVNIFCTLEEPSCALSGRFLGCLLFSCG